MIDQIEKEAVVALFPFMGGEPVIIDCGSNKGNWSDIILNEFNGNCQLHLIEPIQKLLSFTQIKYEYRRNVTYHQFLAYKADFDKLPFHYFENFNNEISSMYDGGKDWEGLPKQTGNISAKTLETFCKDTGVGRIDYLKIDCEGADIDVLLGAMGMMQQGKIGVIQIEYSEHWQRAEYNFSNLKDIADKYGYKIYGYIGGNFWEEKSVMPEYGNYFLTKYEIHNHSTGGWNSQFILNTADLPKFDMVLEIGCFEGITTRYISEKILNPEGRVICVDPLKDYYIEGDTEHPYFRHQYQRFLRNTRGLPIELKRGKSEEELPKLNALRFNLCYIDGDHRENSVYHDCSWAFAVTKEQGFILIDDYTWREETTRGIDKFLNEFAGSMEVILKDYQVLIRKTQNQYNELTYEYYK